MVAYHQFVELSQSADSEERGQAAHMAARAYLAHPVLGERLRQCTKAVLQVEGRTLHAIFGSPDDMKFGSSMTLFSLADKAGDSLFRQALDRCCDGRPDRRTLDLVEDT